MKWALLVGALQYFVSCFCSPSLSSTGNLKSELAGGYIVVAGGNDFYHNSRQSVFLLNTRSRKWSSMADLPTPRCGFQFFNTNGKLFSAGGNDHSSSSSFLLFNSTSSSWEALNNLYFAADAGPSGAILDGSLFLVGGDFSGRTQVMNLFGFANWVPGAHLQQARVQCGTATLGNYIYTCGDQSSDANGKTCEKYDPVSNSWSFIASMNDYRMGKILVALNGYLYAVGGNNLGTAERYDPATNAWTYIHPVTDHGRSYSAATTDGKLIYLVGGCDEIEGCHPGTETNTMEIYIPQVDEWMVLPSMPEARENPAIAYLSQLPV